jgi:hypothetical protein
MKIFLILQVIALTALLLTALFPEIFHPKWNTYWLAMVIVCTLERLFEKSDDSKTKA